MGVFTTIQPHVIVFVRLHGSCRIKMNKIPITLLVFTTDTLVFTDISTYLY